VRTLTKDTWMTLYIRYMADKMLISNLAQAKVVQKNVRQYTLFDSHPFRHDYAHPQLTSVSGDQIEPILTKLHEEICGNNIGKRALSFNIVRARYHCPTIKENNITYAKRCERCQKHVDRHCSCRLTRLSSRVYDDHTPNYLCLHSCLSSIKHLKMQRQRAP